LTPTGSLIVDFTDSRLTRIPSGSLDGLVNATHLFFNNSKIDFVGDYAFATLSKLRYLYDANQAIFRLLISPSAPWPAIYSQVFPLGRCPRF
jgi:hypothetical protein